MTEAPRARRSALTSEEQAVVAKAARHLIPLMGLLYVVSFLDRVNVSYAALTMNADIGLSASAFGLGAGIFFIGYFLFEVPSNLILHRVGARAWIARILVTWGLVAMGMAWVQGPTTFLIGRFLLGVAEAGFFPGMILYLTYWFPGPERGRIIGSFMLAVPVASAIGGPVSTALLGTSLFGLAGWQTMFVVEGLPAVALGFVVLRMLPDRPASAPWLSEGERRCLEALVARDEPAPTRLMDGLASARVWLFASIYFGLVLGLYGFGFWAPQIIKSLGHLTNVQVGLISAIPYLAAAIAMVAWGRHSDTTGERVGHVCAPAALGAAGFLVSATATDPYVSLIALTCGAVGIYAALPVFWTLPTVMLSGTAAAGGIALINSVGNLGGYLGPYAVGWLKDWTGGYAAGLFVLSGAMLGAGLLVLLIPRRSPPVGATP
ncbi:MAG TPA: MFS transporter [Vicinamibacteria bacterium]|nr:MFS transporter [Vicinamibacteria bacterium]